MKVAAICIFLSLGGFSLGVNAAKVEFNFNSTNMECSSGSHIYSICTMVNVGNVVGVYTSQNSQFTIFYLIPGTSTVVISQKDALDGHFWTGDKIAGMLTDGMGIPAVIDTN